MHFAGQYQLLQDRSKKEITMKNLLILMILFLPSVSFSAPDTEKSFKENTCVILCEDSKEQARSAYSQATRECGSASSECSKAYAQAKETCSTNCDSDKNTEQLMCTTLAEVAAGPCNISAIQHHTDCIKTCRSSDYKVSECDSAKRICDAASLTATANEIESKRDCRKECKS